MSLQRAYFITPAYIKDFYSGYIDGNVDDNTLNTFILIAESVRTQSVLGYNLFNKYITDINAGGSPVGTNYIYLADNFIQPATALWTLYEAIPSIAFKLTNKSVSQQSSQYGQPSQRNDIEYLRTGIKNNAEFYDARIKEYILNNQTFYPEYWTTIGVNRIHPKRKSYTGGLYLGRRNGYDWDCDCD